MDLVSIILPTFNESANILPLIEAITKQLTSQRWRFEIIVVDDNSPDGTAQLVAAYAKRQRGVAIKVLVRTSHPGLGNSILAGIKAAKGTIIVGMDADFNHDPATLPKLLEALRVAQLVVASRFQAGGGMTSWWRLGPTWILNRLFQFLGMPIADNTSGFYAIRTRDLRKLGLESIYYGYGDYHLRLVAFAAKAGYTITEIPTYYGERLGGKSKSQLLNMVWTYTREVWRLRKRR